ncbi:MAG: M15 family metallopeptidase [Clostridiales bacterium]|jgi:D-alanyl-D-alanine carboxypeptidase|nr:M15 family metallopeptidase [Clostridiales bacterium]
MDYIEHSVKVEKRSRRIKFAAAAAMLAVAALIAAGVFWGGDGNRSGADREGTTGAGEAGKSEVTAEISYDSQIGELSESESKSSASKTTGREESAALPTEETTYAYAYAGFSPAIANVDIDEWWLILVNRDNILPDDFSVSLAEAAPGTGVNLDERVAPHYAKMYSAALSKGIKLTPLSGHRRISTQKKNFENKILYYRNMGYGKAEATQLAAKIILPPGTSEHNAGLAMDICSLDVSFEKSNEFKWLSENAADYGFILRYPKDKTDITKITYEPWHWRYVGVKDAKKIKALGVCLEEYLDM